METPEEHKQPFLGDQTPPLPTSTSPTSPSMTPDTQEAPVPVPPLTKKAKKRPARKAIKKTFKATALLTKLLPTGSVLAFQIMLPIITNQGRCLTPMNRYMTLCLLILCGLSCFFQCLTDSFKDVKGKVRYGLATFNGLWVMDGSTKLSSEEASRYKLRFLDVFHATMSAMVFCAVALFEKNVVSCLFPEPAEETKELLSKLPFGVGLVGSLLFLAFPTKRHGIGTPVSQ